ncbi:Metallo-dependent hydrolase [Mytilinidion resinicola]|uniref:Metallo-dependent hydrolase n=1 Tax=Mytilinidion resinicola TaxID=574789 RepID=A0A6A6YJM4_9PEZI|nr:Metallo-dependent hydrolase [Mytilinidion resinicola]KAF2809052.1 Metallo-dependent hydrolase [Mytilinidion resinicola]
MATTETQVKYKTSRDNLVKVDEKVNKWYKKAAETKIDKEEEAGEIIRKIREDERRTLFGNLPSEQIPEPETLDMGGQFLTNRDRIEKKSKLYEIAVEAPKGALLHLHFNAELEPETLLREARRMSNMFIRSTLPILKRQDLEQAELVFNVVPEDTVSQDIFSPDYFKEGDKFIAKTPFAPNHWMRWTTFREVWIKKYGQDETITKDHHALTKYPESNGGFLDSSVEGKFIPDAAERWLITKMVLSEDEAYGPRQTVNGVWARFNQATRCFKGLLNYEQVYKWYIGNAIQRMIEEKIMYAELRPMLLDKFIPKNDGIGQISNSEQMKLIVDGVNAKKEELKKQGLEDKFPFGLKIIYCTPRSIPKVRMVQEMQDCIELKLQFPDLICGFDLVGAEDRPNNIGYYHQELVAFQETCDRLKLDIPFMFHAGETLLDTGGSARQYPQNSNLYDAVLLKKSKRIGHGFSLTKHPHLIEEFKKKDICIELCPISNELLHLCRNVKEHPYPQLLAAGIPCTVNSDNPSLFSNSMSHEFYQVMVGTPTMNIYGWRQLAEWSLEYSCLSAADKKRGLDIFRREWAEFCAWIVKTYNTHAEAIVEPTLPKI